MTTADRGVDEVDPMPRSVIRQLPGRLRQPGGMLHQHGAGPHRRQQAAVHRHLKGIRVLPQAQAHDVADRGHIRNRVVRDV
jgi:hypothetical protein